MQSESEDVGQKIKALLEIKNIKRTYLAKEMGISYNTLTKKLNGQREFTLYEIYKIQKIFNIDNDTYSKIIFGKDFWQ